MTTEKLFMCPHGSSMKFTIYKKKMLNMEYNQLVHKIVSHGGVFLECGLANEECIILCKPSDIPQYRENVFDARFVKKCIEKKECLNLNDFWLRKSPNCIEYSGFAKFTEPKCEHCASMEKTLAELEKMLGIIGGVKVRKVQMETENI